MIKAIIVFNNQGKPRLIKFFVHYVSQEPCAKALRCVILNNAHPLVERGRTAEGDKGSVSHGFK